MREIDMAVSQLRQVFIFHELPTPEPLPNVLPNVNIRLTTKVVTSQ